MPSTKHDPERLATLYAQLGTYAAVAEQEGIPESSVRAAIYRAKGRPAGETRKDATIIGLNARIRQLERQALSDERVLKEILKVTQTRIDPPSWLAVPKGKVTDLAGVPVLFASDWHWGEVVRAEEVGHVNEYSLSIARERARTFFQKSTALLTEHLRPAKYPGVVLMLGGDMLSGDIHEELAQTNECESMPALLDLLEVVSWGIGLLAAKFGQVYVVGVTGNHGRTSKKPRAKRRNHTNYDWLLYQLLVRQFAGDRRVGFLIPDGPDAYFKVYGTRICLTHGDSFRGGNGFAGAVVPIFGGDRKKRSQQAQIARPYDLSCIGHWHQYIPSTSVLVNGSLKGFDEWSLSMGFGFERACQALFIVHPVHSVTFHMPIYVQRDKPEQRAESWVSVQRAA